MKIDKIADSMEDLVLPKSVIFTPEHLDDEFKLELLVELCKEYSSTQLRELLGK
jgi:hypothetical protein